MSEETILHRRARLDGFARIGGDQIVGLVIILLDAGDVEGARRLADQAELRPQIGRRLGPLRLVLVVYVIAEGFPRFVEDHAKMRRLCRFHLAHQLPQHGAEALHGLDGQAVALAAERRQGVIGAENIARSVNEIEMIAGLELGGLGHGRHYMPSGRCGCERREGREAAAAAARPGHCADGAAFGYMSPRLLRHP